MEQLRHSPKPDLSPLKRAQQTAEWLPEYLYGTDNEAGLLSQVTQQRLEDLFGANDQLKNLERLKASFQQLTVQQQAAIGLYVAGYEEKAIDVLSEVTIGEVLDCMRQLDAPVAVPAPKVVKRQVNGSGYIPLKTVAEILTRSSVIDEVKFAEDRTQVQQLPAEVLRVRMGWAMQYLPATAVDSWTAVTDEWLQGTPLDELARQHGMSAIEIAKGLGRIGKILLRDPPPSVRRQAGGDLEWQDRALCLHVDGDAFFPEKGYSGNDAKKICTKCPVNKECHTYRQQRGDRHGVWGEAPVDTRSAAQKPRSA